MSLCFHLRTHHIYDLTPKPVIPVTYTRLSEFRSAFVYGLGGGVKLVKPIPKQSWMSKC